jgi:hypothetical protein
LSTSHFFYWSFCQPVIMLIRSIATLREILNMVGEMPSCLNVVALLGFGCRCQ